MPITRPADPPCPHCKMRLGFAPSDSVGHRCKLCGAPVIPVDESGAALSGREVAALTRARKAQRGRWIFRAGSWAGLLLGLGSMLLTAAFLWVANLDLGWTVGSLLAASIPWLFGLYFWRKAGGAQKVLDASLHEARLSAARDILDTTERPHTAEQLGAAMRLPAPEAELLLSQLNVDDSVVSDVTETGDITYTSVKARMRFEPGTSRDVEPPPAASPHRAEPPEEHFEQEAGQTPVSSRDAKV